MEGHSENLYALLHSHDADRSRVRIQIPGGPQVLGLPGALEARSDELVRILDLLIIVYPVDHNSEFVEVILDIISIGPALVA